MYPWQDAGAGDRDEDPILGWNRGVVGGLDPRLVKFTNTVTAFQQAACSKLPYILSYTYLATDAFWS